MRHYEIMVIYNIDLEDDAKKASGEVDALIGSLGGSILNRDFWGKRKFAYPINHQVEGYYDVIKFDLPADKVRTIEEKLGRMPSVVRYLITARE